MEKAGDRWWPICGGVYVVRAIKRNVGVRLVLPEWRDKRAPKKALALGQGPCRASGKRARGCARESRGGRTIALSPTSDSAAPPTILRRALSSNPRSP